MKLIYWNVWQVPSIFTDKKGPERAKGVNDILMNNFDVVILNEAFTNKDIMLTHLDYKYMLKTGKDTCRLGCLDSGLMILSKYPIVYSDYFIYNDKSNFDIFASKGCLVVKISYKNKIYTIYNTHMQAGGRVKDNKVRMKQTDELINYIQKISKDEDFLLAGDYNMSEDLESGHFENKRDAQERVETFNKLVDTLELTKQNNGDIMGYLSKGESHKVNNIAIVGTDYSDTAYVACDLN
jgi:exonuclease III